MRHRLAGRTVRPRRDFLHSVSRYGLVALSLAGAAGTAQAQTVLPTGGTVASGSASIASDANGVTVTQTSDRAIVNWTGFDVGVGKSVVFEQPDAQSATLNRVTGTAGSTIAGSIMSNGAVYLVNPNGIAITSTGQVQTGGGFVASTLDIADDDFNAGELAFTGTGASKRVSNKGTIISGSGGYVALLGGTVLNTGTITVALGTVGLGSGESIALDLAGDGFMRVAVPTATITQGDTALIEMTGNIAASGGRVVLSAATVKDAVRNVVNVPGSIVVDSATGNGGSIVLLGGDGGTVHATGTLSARATGASGDGGFVETSGAAVDFAGLKVDTSAAHGATGTWLVDPTDLTVDAAAAATISSNLATSNVTLQTTSTTASGPGVQSAGSGDINVNSAIGWTSANTLSLLAYNNIALNAAITGAAGGLTLTAGNNVPNTGAVTATGAVNVGVFNLTNGNWSQLTATLPTFFARDFRFTVGRARFLRATGGTGAAATPYVFTDVFGLQGLASRSYLSASATLGGDIDASGTVNWNAGAGFNPIGTPANGFSGTFNGANHVISGLTINRPTTDFVGLFGSSAGNAPTIRNVGLVGGSVRGAQYVGALFGDLENGSISDSYASVAVTGTRVVGGLAGNAISVTRAYATGTVTSTGDYTGGLVGLSGSGISNSYATGAVSSTGLYTGGLGGYISGATSNSYATGSVTSTGQYTGGLLGLTYTQVTSSYASGAVNGTTSVGGLVGTNTNGNATATVTNSYWDIYSSGQNQAAGNVTNVAGVTAVTSDPSQSGAANYAYTAATYANLTVATGLGTATPSGFVFLPGDITRPFLAFEVPTSATLASNAGGSLLITNSHQLELIGYDSTRLAQNYALANDISLAETGAVTAGMPASYAGMWAATGFNPIGRLGGQGGLTGNFDGQNHVISGLTIRDTSGTIYVGLVGFTSGGNISNVGLTGVNVIGGNGGGIGGLVGQFNNGTLSNSYVTGTVSGGSVGSNVGGLVGSLTGTITNSYASATVSGTSVIGGLVGVQSNTNAVITNSYATGNVSGTSLVGGLVGNSGASIRNAYATGTVTATGNTVGGLVGSFGGTNNTVTSAYATGAVTSGGTFIGGLIGRVGSGNVGSVYATGSVNGASSVGGLVGYQTGGTINGGYASGAVSGSASTTGGLIGQQTAGTMSNPATLTNAYWDLYSTSQGSAVGSVAGMVSATNPITSNPNAAGGATAYRANSYANLPGASGIGTATPTGFVFVAGDTTRPFLAAEAPVKSNGATVTNAAGQVVIGNAHQLQLVDYNAATLSGNYTLGGNIDLTETGANTGTAASSAGMWGATGFVSLGSDGAGALWNGANFVTVGYADVGRAGIAAGFSGSLNGGGFTLSNLLVNRGTTQNVGLFGGSSGTISNLTVTGNVTGYVSVGGLVGLQQGGSISGVTSAVNVTGSSGSAYVGGLVGFASGTAIASSSASGAISATGAAGGLVGLLYNSTLTNSSASAVVTGRDGRSGGLVGIVEAATVTGGSSTGTVNGVAGGTSYGVLRDGGTYNGVTETSGN